MSMRLFISAIGVSVRYGTSTKRASLKDLQSLLGKLNFICNTVRSGRVFVSRLINAIRVHPTDGLHEIPDYIIDDIKWWDKYMESFDGISIMPHHKWTAPDRIFSTDACLKGCGGESEDTCFAATFPQFIFNDWGDLSINELEALAIVICLKLWSHKIKNKNVLVFCDNSSTVDIVNTGKARNPFSQQCLREICWFTLTS